MPPLPRATISAPDGYEPKPYGLLETIRAASFLDAHSEAGFEYQSPACGHNVGYASGTCLSVTGTTGTGTPPNLPSTVTVNSDIVGTYTVVWGDATADTTITITEGETSETTPNHNYATAGNKNVVVTGPAGFGTYRMTLVANSNGTYTATPDPKVALPSDTTVLGDPITVLGRYDCRPIGQTMADMQKRAMDALGVSESWAVEKVLRDRYFTPLSSDITSGTATSIERAIALLENYAAVNYAGRPVLHLSQFAASLAQAKGIIERHGNHLETVVGSLVVVGSGYSTHPVGASSPIYVTGRVIIQQGQAMVNQAHRMISGNVQNESVFLAERTTVVAVECQATMAKALVTTA